MSTATTNRIDVYTRVTNRIVEDLERGVRPWMKPWDAAIAGGRVGRPLRHNGEPYKGINILMLWDSAESQGFSGSPYWLTFRQTKELGGFVKKGEHGTPVVYASSFTKKEKSETGEDIETEISFLKEYCVFNSLQCEGLADKFYPPAQPLGAIPARIERADQFFANTQADIRIGGNRAFYSNDGDYIRMPPIAAFRDAESFSATLGHETVHWTKNSKRLDRDFGRKRWGDEGYAMEELVAELGSAFLCADLEITLDVRPDHASYLDSWIKVLRNDRRAVFSAAAHASKAVDFLHGLQPEPAA